MPRINVDKDVARWLKQAVERSEGQAKDENRVLRILLGLDDMPVDPDHEQPQATMALGEINDPGEFEFPPMHPWRQHARFFAPDHRLFEAETVALQQLGLLCGATKTNGHEDHSGEVCVLVDGHYPKTPHIFYKPNFLVHRAELLECLREIMPPETEVHH